MPPQQSSRIDLVDLRTHIVNKVGDERSKKYFYCLNRFFSQKLNKSELDRSCFHLLGRENLSLHNQFIQSILKNAYLAKRPPQICKVGPSKSVNQAGKVSTLTREDELKQSGSLVADQNQSMSHWPNGVFPVSPRKVRSGMRDRKLRDRPSQLGRNGKVDSLPNLSTSTDDSVHTVLKENGGLLASEYQQLVDCQVLAEQPMKVSDSSVQRHTDKDQAVFEDEVEQANHFSLSRSSLIAPLGFPFCRASVGGAHKPVSVAGSSKLVSYCDSGGLSDTGTLRKRMEQIASAQDLEQVSLDCANTLNHMLDFYLKRLIRSCFELVGAGSHRDSRRNIVCNQHVVGRVLNGMWPNNHLFMQIDSDNAEIMQEQRQRSLISLLDFKVAMDLNPQQLGEDWSLQLEKICIRAFEE